MRTVFFNLLVKNEYRDVEKLLRNNSKNLEYLINDINSEAEGTSQTYQGVDTLAYSMSARIIIVNTDYNVIYDSFRLMRDTYIMDNDIHRIMSGDEAEKMVADAASIEYMFPVVNREGYTDDVAVVAVSLKDFNDNMVSLDNISPMNIATHLTEICKAYRPQVEHVTANPLYVKNEHVFDFIKDIKEILG